MRTKNLILTILLVVTLSASLRAQDKYTYAAVALTGQLLTISTADNFEEVRLTKDDFKKSVTGADTGPLIKKINEMAKEGWEVCNTTDMSSTQFVHTVT